jgi:hypothetical protein
MTYSSRETAHKTVFSPSFRAVLAWHEGKEDSCREWEVIKMTTDGCHDTWAMQ